MDGGACPCDLSYLVPEAMRNRVIWYIGHPAIRGSEAARKRRKPTVYRYSVNSEKRNKMQRKKRTTIPGNCTEMYTKKEHRSKSEQRENAQKCTLKKEPLQMVG